MKSLNLFAAGVAAIGCAMSAHAASSAPSNAQPVGGLSPFGAAKDGVIAGVINANGGLQFSPAGFTASHPSTGRYIVTFNKAFAKSALCVYQPVGGAVRVASLSVNSKTCDVTFVSLSLGAVTDSLFVFFAANAN